MRVFILFIILITVILLSDFISKNIFIPVYNNNNTDDVITEEPQIDNEEEEKNYILRNRLKKIIF